jgi:hypothetical protein
VLEMLPSLRAKAWRMIWRSACSRAAFRFNGSSSSSVCSRSRSAGDQPPVGHDDRALHPVFQFAHIARPAPGINRGQSIPASP